jgi:methylase of polypeptide subunit release factors
MTPQAFIAHWQNNNITERAGAQQHFNDLCEMLSVEKPRDAENYTFERGAKMQGGQGWADVWKRGCFAWEYKAPGRDLNAALKQLMNYALALDNPPLLVVSDLRNIEIHTHFTGHPSEIHRIEITQLTQPETLQKLKWLFNEPERFKPQRTTYAVTELAAKRIGDIAKRLNERGNAAEEVAHFLIQCVFCMFAEDAKLLPEKLFETVLDKSNPDGSKAQKRLTELFNAMQGGGDFAMNDIPWFNGGLFKVVNVPILQTNDVVSLLEAARMDWSQIEPAILGTLFERGLNPDMRSQLGAHYTDPATIMKIIKPVIEQPLLAEWSKVKEKIAALAPKMALVGSAKSNRPNKEMAEGYQLFRDFLTRLKNFKVLDPACGSGNFLYLALKTLKDIEHRVNLEIETFGLHRELSIETSPANVLGIELNPYAAELARVTVWIGEIQWMLSHGYQYRKDPILAPLDHIENRDAILNTDGTEAQWPAVDAIVGNPPFLGGSKKRRELGDDYFNALSAIYKTRVPDGADLVCYWFEKARAQIEQSKTNYVGLVSTNSIRGGSSRKVLERILNTGSIFEAWSDEAWVNNGAAVRVSLICYRGKATPLALLSLDGQFVTTIFSDLTAHTSASHLLTAGTVEMLKTIGKYAEYDLTQAKPLRENFSFAFQGPEKNGAFDIKGDLARTWLAQPNPNGKPNSDVVKPRWNGIDLTRRHQDIYVIDYGTKTTEAEAALYELPFSHVVSHVKPERDKNKDKNRRQNWWRFGRTGEDIRNSLSTHKRYIALSSVTKHIFWKWLQVEVIPDKALIVVALSDDTAFGILHSRFHELWSLRMGTSLEDRPRYTPTTCFETFPFPQGLTPKDLRGSHPHGDATIKAVSQAVSQAIAQAAQRLNELRENWLNPPEWVDWVITPEEEKVGYPKRAVAKAGFEAELKKRTLTNLYNQRPAWLDNAHKTLDAAVVLTYGWQDYTPEMPDDEILRRLLKLNLERAAQ